MKKLLTLTSTLLVLLCLQAQAQTRHVVLVEDAGFNPSTITVNAGDMVVWKSTSTFDHTSTSGSNCTADGTWDSGTLEPGDSFVMTFNDVATFPYFCEPHCQMGMTGTVVVTQGSGVKEVAISNATVGQVFPNPAITDARIQVKLNTKEVVRMDIIDLQGRTVYSGTQATLAPGSHLLDLPVDALQSGLYVCRLTIGESQVITQRFNKQ